MTMIHTFTDSIPKGRLTLFSDFIGEMRPFGYAINPLTGNPPTISFSNDNSDGLGRIDCELSGVQVASGYQRVAVYQMTDTSGLINRLWNIRNPSGISYAFECRVKTSVHSSAACLMTCGYTLTHNTALQVGAYFYHLNGESTWKAAISAGSAVPGQNVIAEVDTKLPVSSYQVLRVESYKQATEFLFYANGTRVLKWIGTAVNNDLGLPMPCIEIRDRVSGGGGRNNSFSADYMMTEERFER